jgi:hypothetical protein
MCHVLWAFIIFTFSGWYGAHMAGMSQMKQCTQAHGASLDLKGKGHWRKASKL